MATLHIFNPEHDIALAANLSNFTAPHAGRLLRNDLGFLPAIWAEHDDKVLVENMEHAEKSWNRLKGRMKRLGLASSHVDNDCFVIKKHAVTTPAYNSIKPWGWDLAIRRELERLHIPSMLLPNDKQTELIRLLSHRRTASKLLPLLQQEGTVGEAFECNGISEIEELQACYHRLILKAPWSSSGRGLRFVNSHEDIHQSHMQGWLRNLFASQGSVMCEPLYNKVKDFGMEFEVDGEGCIQYKGLSLFHTLNGAYIGNILATENKKREMISRYLPLELLDSTKDIIMNTSLLKGYEGCFGIDMMVVGSSNGFILHPCVELNLRRTMGHVALQLQPDDDDVVRVMRIELTDHYRLRLMSLIINE